MRRLTRLVSAFAACCLIIAGFAASSPSRAAAASPDAFDTLRTKWITALTGGTGFDVTDPDVARRIDVITDAARASWSALDVSAGRTRLFPDYPSADHNQNITDTYGRLRGMALAYRTYGSPLYGDTKLRDDIVSAIDWLHANWYHAGLPFRPQSPDNNWFAWELGVPLTMVDLLGLMYDDLTSEQVSENVEAIDYFLPDPTKLGLSVGWHLKSEGANRAWAATSIGKRGILGKDAAKIQTATTSLSPLFQYAQPGGNGFFTDGSVLFHEGLPYTTGYGWGNLGDPTAAVVLYEGSPWAITDPGKYNLVSWVKDSFAPFVFRNRITDSLSGRQISRPGQGDRADALISNSLYLLSVATPADQAYLKSLIKYLVTSDPSLTWFTTTTLPNIVRVKAIVADSSVQPLVPGKTYTQFPTMDRNVMQRPGYAFGTAMFSSRTQNYESINNENVAGWHTADGRTWLYTSDLDQYGGDYWATVDPDRIPGTTVLQHRPDDVLAPQVGRVTITGAAPLTDELTDLSKAFYTSPRWTVDSATPDAFAGDAARVRRTADSHESLIYKVGAGMTSFSLDTYYTGSSGLDRFQLAVSPNNSGYQAVKFTAATTPLRNGWTKATLTPASALPAGQVYLRIDLMPSIPQSRGDRSWVGGADLDGTVGAAGMQVRTPGQSLTGNKSWFMLDDEIVALGSDIAASDGRDARTTVENRRTTDRFPGRLTVDGTPVLRGNGTESLPGASWAELDGGAAGSDIGYYFPGGADLTATRETRSGNWADVGNGPAAAATNDFVGLDVDHGVDPKNGSYSYVLLPDRNAGQTRAYAQHPDVSVLAADERVHAVRDAKAGLVAANFWQDGATTVNVAGKDFLTSNRKASVLTKEDPRSLTVSVSDPTQENNKSGDIVDGAQDFSRVFDRSADWVIESGGGFKRSKQAVEYLTYRLESVVGFEVDAVYNYNTGLKNTSSILDRVKFYASADNATWTPVGAKLKDPVTPVYGWALDNEAVLVPDGDLPAGTQYLKIEVQNNDTRAAWSPQLKHVTVKSGPTDDGYIDVTLDRTASGVISADPRVQVVSLDPVKLRVDVDHANGQSVQARLAYALPPNAGAVVPDGAGPTPSAPGSGGTAARVEPGVEQAAGRLRSR